jgi:hypothetical protein
MDWPGAQEMAKRFAKTIDPKLLGDDDKSPELQAAEQQMQAMGQELDQMHAMLKNVSQSMEAQELKIKTYDAETKRISATMAGMTPDQIQDVVLGTIHGMMESGDLMPQGGGMPEMPQQEMMGEQPEMPPEAMQ